MFAAASVKICIHYVSIHLSTEADDIESQVAKKSKKQEKFRALKEKRRELMSASAAQPVVKTAARENPSFADDLSLASMTDKLRFSAPEQQAARFRQLIPGLPERSALETAASVLKGTL